MTFDPKKTKALDVQHRPIHSACTAALCYGTMSRKYLRPSADPRVSYGKMSYFFNLPLKFVPGLLSSNKSALAAEMGWHQLDTRPFLELMVTMILDARMRTVIQTNICNHNLASP